MSPYTFVLFVHVLAAVVLVGNSVLTPVIRNLLCEATTVDRLLDVLLIVRRITRGAPAAAVVVLASGIYLGSAGWWTEGWFYVSIATWVASLLLAVLVVDRLQAEWRVAAQNPGDRQLRQLDEGRQSSKWNRALAAMTANDVAMVFVMVAKPGLLGAIGFVVAANALSMVAFMRTRPRPQSLRPSSSGFAMVTPADGARS